MNLGPILLGFLLSCIDRVLSPSDELEHDDSEGPDIDRFGVFLLTQNLRRGVEQGATGQFEVVEYGVGVVFD